MRLSFISLSDRAGLNQIPLAEWFRRHPDDLETLEIAVGAMSGQMGNIDETGAPAIYFHAYVPPGGPAAPVTFPKQSAT